MLKTVSLLTILCCSWLNTIGQDTIFFDNKQRFHQAIIYGYMDYYWRMPEDLFGKIDSVFHTIDFNKPEIPCQNDFRFLADIDSCGVILDCLPLKNKLVAPEMLLFEEKVNNLIIHSNWRVNNVAKMVDTTFIFKQLRIRVNTSCEPEEIFIAPENWTPDMIKILAYRNENEFIVFDYFTNNCAKNK